MAKLSHRKLGQFAQGYTARKWENPGGLNTLYTTTSTLPSKDSLTGGPKWGTETRIACSTGLPGPRWEGPAPWAERVYRLWCSQLPAGLCPQDPARGDAILDAIDRTFQSPRCPQLSLWHPSPTLLPLLPSGHKCPVPSFKSCLPFTSYLSLHLCVQPGPCLRGLL